MIRKYRNHKLQTWHLEEEPHKNHEPPGRQTKLSNQQNLETNAYQHYPTTGMRNNLFDGQGFAPVSVKVRKTAMIRK